MSSADKLPSNTVTATAGDDCRRSSQLLADTLDPIFRTVIETPARAQDFHAGLSTYFLGPALFFRTELAGTTYRFTRDESRIVRTGLDLIFIQLSKEGADKRTVNGETMLVEPGDISIFDLARPLEAETQHTRNISLAMPRHLLFSKDGQNDALHGMLIKNNTSAARLIGSHMRTLFNDLSNIRQSEAPLIVSATANLITNLLGPQASERSSPAPTVRGAVILEIRRYIEQHVAMPDLGPDHLCKMFGLSRASLYRLFEPIGGVTDYIRTRRLRSAFDMLTHEERRTIGEVAYACGFSDISAFSRAFRHQFGMSPSEVRDMGDRGTTPSFGAIEANGSSSVHDWLRIVSAL